VIRSGEIPALAFVVAFALALALALALAFAFAFAFAFASLVVIPAGNLRLLLPLVVIPHPELVEGGRNLLL
jgi:hypothetical protein